MWELVRQISGDREGVVGRAVLHDQDLEVVAARPYAFGNLADGPLEVAGFVVRGHDNRDHWTPSSEPGIGKRQRGVEVHGRARDLGGVRSRLDDHEARSRRGERAVRLDGGDNAVDRYPQRIRWPLRPRLVASEREATE